MQVDSTIFACLLRLLWCMQVSCICTFRILLDSVPGSIIRSFALSAATGRTVVLPPKQNLHLEVSWGQRVGLNSTLSATQTSHISLTLQQDDSSSSVDSFEQFYSFHSEEFKKRVNVISMKEFLEKEGRDKGLISLDVNDYMRVLELSTSCQNRRKSEYVAGDDWGLICRLCLL